MLSGDSKILTEKLKQCFKTGNFDDLHEGIFGGRTDVPRALVGRFHGLFEETAMKTNPDGSVTEQVFIDFRKWGSLPAVVEVLKKAGRRQLGL